ncbi:class I SAM-dependent methyltransferase [bacterium]|nr:class I SAM-dependent methyltransferase [bacterium]
MSVNPQFPTVERQQKAYYDSIAGQYDDHYSERAALKYRYWVYDFALKEVHLKGRTVLDAMCGGGQGTGYLMARDANVVGLDISEKCCDIYRRRYSKARIVCSSILQTGFPDSYFDIIITDSLHHLPPNLEAAIAEIDRILKPGGYLCCWEPNANSLPDYLRRVWYRLDTKFFRENEQSISIDWLKRKYNDRFEVVSTTYGGNVAYLLVNCSMALRIPPRIVSVYAPALLFGERVLTPFQPKFMSLWVLCLIRKTSKNDKVQERS